MVVPTLVKVLLALLPRAVMAVMQTTMIKASMTAYSTAVGPSSAFRNRWIDCSQVRMDGIAFLFPAFNLAPRVGVNTHSGRDDDPGTAQSSLRRRRSI